MEFDKSRIYTVVNADEVKLGSAGYFADSIYSLQQAVQHNDKECFGKVDCIKGTNTGFRFVADNGTCFSLFYFIEEQEEKELRPYKDTDEMIDHFCRHFNLIPQDHRLPTLWVKNNDKKYLITRVSENTVTVCFEENVFTFGLIRLLDDYMWLDGSPCGIEE